MEQINSILADEIQAVFFLILATIVWLFCIGYMVRQLRRKKYGRRRTDQKIIRQKPDDSLAEEKTSS